jgi:hypothetical protein
MNRKEFIQKSLQTGIGCCALMAWNQASGSTTEPPQANGEPSPAERERDFLRGWIADLVNAMGSKLDRKAQVKLMEGTGRGCYRRYQFKQDIAAQGKGDLPKLIEAYKKNFEIWQEGKLVHIRYGEVSRKCYCPAANYRPATPNDVHCECTRMTHQTIFETALGRAFQVDIVESLRRGGKTCHFVVHMS